MLLTSTSGAHAEMGASSCAYAIAISEWVQSIDEGALRSGLTKKISDLHATKDLSPFDQNLLDELTELSISAQLKQDLLNEIRSICVPEKKSIGPGLVRFGKISAEVMTTVVTAPVRFVGHFAQGVLTRRAHSRGPSYADLMGIGKGSAVDWIWTFYGAIRAVFFSANPFTFAFDVVSTVDMHAGIFCRSSLEKTEASLRFCKRYESIKKIEFQVVIEGDRLGVSLGRDLLQWFDFRSDAHLNEAICLKPPHAQFRIAKRAAERLLLRLSDDDPSDYSVNLIPPRPHGCVSIRVSSKKKIPDDFSANGTIDGIHYVMFTEETKSFHLPEPVDYCETLIRKDFISRARIARDISLAWKIDQVVINPSRFSEASWLEYPNAHLTQDANPANRNVILILSPSQKQEDEYDLEKPILANLNQDLKRERKTIRYLKTAPGYDECLVRLKETRFDPIAYSKLFRRVKKNEFVQNAKFLKLTQKQLKSAGKKWFGLVNALKHDWETVPFSNLNQIRNALRDPSIANLIIVLHGSEIGKFEDAELNIFPYHGFGNISPHLRSLSIFTCHGEQIVQSYPIAEILRNQESPYPVRLVGYSKSHDFMESSNSTPLVALSSFMVAVDKKIVEIESNSTLALGFINENLSAPLPEEECVAQVTAADFDMGAFDLDLNSQWIGTLYPGEGKRHRYRFPCRWLKPGSTFLLEDASGPFFSKLQNTNSLLQVWRASNPLQPVYEGTPKPEGIFRRETDQSIMGVEWDFKD